MGMTEILGLPAEALVFVATFVAGGLGLGITAPEAANRFARAVFRPVSRAGCFALILLFGVILGAFIERESLRRMGVDVYALAPKPAVEAFGFWWIFIGVLAIVWFVFVLLWASEKTGSKH